MTEQHPGAILQAPEDNPVQLSVSNFNFSEGFIARAGVGAHRRVLAQLN